MKLFVHDPNGDALDFAYRAVQNGHEVRSFIKDTPHTGLIGRGLVRVTRDFESSLGWADLTVCIDNTHYLQALDRHRDKGRKIIGPSYAAAQWELDRTLGMNVFKKCGIDVPTYKEFTDYDAAIRYVKKEGRRFVSKPLDDQDKALSYVAKTPADLVYMLERWKKKNKLSHGFILQEMIEGVEMGVGGWFGPDGFIQGWEENFEFKKFMDGDLGIATGEQGTVLRVVRRSKLARLVLEPLEDELARLGYIGNIDVNCIIDDKGQPWPLEFTMRPGWPAFNIEASLCSGDHAEWLYDLTDGKDTRSVAFDTVAVGVVVSIPDYPYSKLTQKETAGVPIYGLKPSTLKWARLNYVMAGEAPTDLPDGSIETLPCLLTAGDYVLTMTATGDTVYEAKQTAMRRIKSLKIPNSPMYRTDIGDRLAKQLPMIQKHGFATHMIFSPQQSS